MDSFLSRVGQFQGELKAPKNQVNKFGNYKYRSCEDILEAAKGLLAKYHLVLVLSDEIQQIGTRYYLKATATLRDMDGAETLSNTAYAREAEEKKGMDDSQITGTASSYARKYALNGLFCIDDTKDADTDAYREQTEQGKGPEKEKAAAQGQKPGLRVPPKDDPPVWCSDCRKKIADYFDGKVLIKAADIAKRNEERYGAPLCPACAQRSAK